MPSVLDMMSPTVFVVIPVFNRWKHTEACLVALQAQSYHPIKVIVVDGGSTDGTPKLLRDGWPTVTVIDGVGELWWAGAMWHGINFVLCQDPAEDGFLLMMNNDTLVEPRYIDTLVRTSQTTGAAVGGLIVDSQDVSHILDAGEFIDWRNYEFTVKTTVMPGEKSCGDVDVLPGRGSLVPLRMIRSVGNVDADTFPHYIADYEFFCRLKSRGFSLLVTYEAQVLSYVEETGIAPTKQLRSFPQMWEVLFSRRSMSNCRDHWRFIQRCAPGSLRVRLARLLLWRYVLLVCFGTPLKLVVSPIRAGYLFIRWYLCSTYYVTDADCDRFSLNPVELVKEGVLVPWKQDNWYIFSRPRNSWWNAHPEARALYWHDWNPLSKPRRWFVSRTIPNPATGKSSQGLESHLAEPHGSYKA